jgi:3-hydroxy-4-methylanthranilate adenylyltransferase
MTMDGTVVVPGTSQGAQWVDEVLLAGPGSDICFRLPDQIDRKKLRQLVRDRESDLAAAGFRAGSAVQADDDRR